MSIILNIETATELSSVCISKDQEILAIKEGSGPMKHSQEITLLIQDCLSAIGATFSQLDAVAVSKGPGSYTALRVGTSVAKGICYAMDIPLIGVDTLKSMAIASAAQVTADFYCPMIDARRKEVYMALYNNEITELKPCQAAILDQDSFGQEVSAGQKIVFSGNGSPKFREMILRSEFVFTNIVCKASNLVPLALEAYKANKFVSVAYFEPTYLKPPNITIPKKRL